MRNIKRLQKKLVALALALTLSLSLFPNLILAGNATLYLSPGSGTKYVGTSFSVAIRTNSGSHVTNAYKAVVKFPTDKLTALSASAANSICTLQITGSPSYSNSAGTVNFECGHTGSFSGTSGRIGTITFSVRAAGTANLSFTTAQIKAADGQGTEVLGSTSGATYTLRTAPISAPAVSSTTHPDQNSWYALNNAAFTWTRPSGAVDFSYTLNRSRRTTPNDIPDGAGISTTYGNLSDGKHYFHIKARGAGGWGKTAHFRIQIDTTPPDPFELISDPPADAVTSAPLIIAKATDSTSGISHYELSFNGDAFQEVPMPYQFPRIKEGVHTVTVRAFDRAGNYREASLVLNVVDIEEPKIIQPAEGEFLPLLEELIISGTSPQGLVELYLNGEFIALVESDGEFYYTHPEFLKPGSYVITAKSITEGGVESEPVEVHFKIDARAVSLFGVTLPGWLVYSLLLGTIAGLILLILILWKKRRKRERHFVEDIERIEREVDKQLDIAEEDLDRAVEETFKQGRKGRILRLERKIGKVEEKAKQELMEELEKIKQHHQPKRLKIIRRVKRMIRPTRDRAQEKMREIIEELGEIKGRRLRKPKMPKIPKFPATWEKITSRIKKLKLPRKLRSLKELRVLEFLKRKTEEEEKEDQKAPRRKRRKRAKAAKKTRTKTVKRKKPKTRRKAR